MKKRICFQMYKLLQLVNHGIFTVKFKIENFGYIFQPRPVHPLWVLSCSLWKPVETKNCKMKLEIKFSICWGRRICNSNFISSILFGIFFCYSRNENRSEEMDDKFISEYKGWEYFLWFEDIQSKWLCSGKIGLNLVWGPEVEFKRPKSRIPGYYPGTRGTFTGNMDAWIPILILMWKHSPGPTSGNRFDA